MQLKFKNSNVLNLFCAVFCSCAMIFLFGFGFIVSSILGQTENNILILEIFGAIIVGIWIIYFIATFLFYKTVVVTQERITLTKWNKVIWTINKEDISECIYQRLTGGNFYSPNAMSMLFKLKSTNAFAYRKINKHFRIPKSISISYKNVNKMIEIGYVVRIINSIHNQ